MRFRDRPIRSSCRALKCPRHDTVLLRVRIGAAEARGHDVQRTSSSTSASRWSCAARTQIGSSGQSARRLRFGPHHRCRQDPRLPDPRATVRGLLRHGSPRCDIRHEITLDRRSRRCTRPRAARRFLPSSCCRGSSCRRSCSGHNGPQDLKTRRSAVCVEPRLITTRSVRRAGPWSSSARFLNRSVRQAAARRISLTERRTRQAYRRQMQTSTTSRSRLRRSRGRLCDLDERLSVLQRLDDPREFRVEATQHLRATRVADSEPTRRKVRRATGRVRRNPRPS